MSMDFDEVVPVAAAAPRVGEHVAGIAGVTEVDPEAPGARLPVGVRIDADL